MALTVYDVREEYIGAGNLASYTFDFKITDLSQLLVIVANIQGVEIQRVRGDDINFLSSVSFDPLEGGGIVNLQANLPSGQTLIILLANDAPTQPSKFRNQGDFTLVRIERALDFLGSIIQRLNYKADRSVKLNDLDDPEDFDPTLPAGLESGLLPCIPVTNETGTGWAPLSKWPTLDQILEGATGSAEQSDYVLNNQSTVDILGLSLSNLYKRHEIDYWVKRIATATVMEVGKLIAWYDGSNWYISRMYFSGDAGVTFDVTSGGQVVISSDNMAGTYDEINSRIGFTLKTMGA